MARDSGYQQHIRQLLTQTITVLCQNSLPYRARFSVEGLLGITLDDDQVFLVNVNQTLDKAGMCVPFHQGSPTPPRESFTTPAYAAIEDDLIKKKRNRVSLSSSSAPNVLPVLPPSENLTMPTQLQNHQQQNIPEELVEDKVARILQSARAEIEATEMVVNHGYNTCDTLARDKMSEDVKDERTEGEEGEIGRTLATVYIKQELPDGQDEADRTPPLASASEEGVTLNLPNLLLSTQSYTLSGKLPCSICGDEFKSHYHLERHMTTHLGITLPMNTADSGAETENDVTKDGAQSDKSETDDAQSTVSTEDKDKKLTHECEVCGLKCKCKSDLVKHMYIHTGQKPHKCDICGKGFRQTSALNVHMKVHVHGNRPYKCSVCGKGFNQSSHLNVHRMIHTGEKPHQCKVCNKGFIASSNLRKHMISHTGEKNYKCSICKQTFGYLPSLKAHIAKH